MNRYIVKISSARTVGAGSNGKYRRPVNIYVLDTAAGATMWYWVRQGIIRAWRNCDSRYSGSRSLYGQSLAEANRICENLNAAN